MAMIDIAMPSDYNVIGKQTNTDLDVELKAIWHVQYIIPLIIVRIAGMIENRDQYQFPFVLTKEIFTIPFCNIKKINDDKNSKLMYQNI